MTKFGAEVVVVVIVVVVVVVVAVAVAAVGTRTGVDSVQREIENCFVVVEVAAAAAGVAAGVVHWKTVATLKCVILAVASRLWVSLED